MQWIHIIKHFQRDTRGVAAVEFGFIASFLVVSLLGLVEMTTFISSKERMNRAANQVAQVLSSVESIDPTEINMVMNTSSQYLAKPYGVSVAAIFCGRSSSTQQYTSAGSSTSCGNMGRSYTVDRPTTPPGQEPNPDRPSSGGTLSTQTGCSGGFSGAEFVRVKAGCSYQPVFNVLGLFSGATVTGESTIPLRNQVMH